MKILGFGSGVETAPGVYTTEQDLTVSPQGGASTEAAIAGVFNWGPAGVARLVTSEDQLARQYGTPTSANPETWFSASSFTSYAQGLWVNRVVDDTARNAIANTGAANIALAVVKNRDEYAEVSATFPSSVELVAKFPGDKGNGLKVSFVANATQYQSTLNLTANLAFTVGSKTATIAASNTANATTDAAKFAVGDYVTAGNSSIGTQDIQVLSAIATGSNVAITLAAPYKLSTDYASNTVVRSWEFASLVSGAPKTSWSVEQAGVSVVDQVHAVVVDTTGYFTGRAGAVLEVFEGLSRATDSRNSDNEPNYYKTMINNQSDYIWTGTTTTGLTSANTSTIAAQSGTLPVSYTLSGGIAGADEANVTFGTLAAGYDKFAHKEEIALSAVIVGKPRGGTYGEQLINYLIDNIAEVRQDVVVYGSLPKAVVVNNRGDELTDAIAFRNVVRKSSYGFLDSGYKFMYDKYNDVNRWIPLSGDIAGLSARTDVTSDPWIAPAGTSRGQIKNVIRLAWNPNAKEQKVLFASDINPVIAVGGEGIYLFGDKTLYGQNSAFGQLGVRKMLNIIKTSLSKACRSLIFEQNDEFSRARFKNMVDPYLRDIEGRRGLNWFRTKADENNNTEEVVRQGRFVGDIYFEPTRSIRTVQLNFVAVGSLAEFTETIA